MIDERLTTQRPGSRYQLTGSWDQQTLRTFSLNSGHFRTFLQFWPYFRTFQEFRTSGTPVLGPFLFNLYCSSLPEAFSCAGFNSMGYADDNLGFRVFPAFPKLQGVSKRVPLFVSDKK